ncbi:transcription elongation factor [Gramella sp. AN32]|uniref:Transcription elongation factor n=1 Tax=Christiangramia antarctica TaxID=2058158 RepID=A0ABW5X3I1_9FLAO|nr:transcription elongation factor [Gramella sp. AN32]MCM4154951.1 transcription elongation factor [Gramella sp. AN32]
MAKEIKRDLIHACEEYLAKKTAVVKSALNGLKEDLENESKSSAGDKYETGREMINIEWNKLSAQLAQYNQLRNILSRISNSENTENVSLGSIVYTENANYFLSIPAGKITFENSEFFAVGIKSPVAAVLLGKKAKDPFEINGKKSKITRII